MKYAHYEVCLENKIDDFLFVSYYRPCSVHAGYIWGDRSLLTGHDVLLLQQKARDLLHELSHSHEAYS